jgi:DNA topoisomerase-1
VVKQCQELPDQELFEYEDEAGEWRDVTSQDVNAYLQDATGESFTAKDFRTWSGTVLAAIALREFEEFTSQKEAKGNIVQAIESVAKMLGNTPTICRKCYVHPQILESYLQGGTVATLQQRSAKKMGRELHALRPEEAAVMVLLQERLKAAAQAKPTKVAALAKTLASSVKRERHRRSRAQR